MSTVIASPTETLTPEQLFAKTQADRGKTPEQLAAEVEPQKRPSGDERKFQKRLARAEERLRGEFDKKLEDRMSALKPKEVDAKAEGTEAPKREAFATDEAYQDARIAHAAEIAAKKIVDAERAENAQSQTIKDAVTGYNERMARGPQKYDDWDDAMKSAKGAALNVDLSAECPALFWAITKSPYNDDVFYSFLKDSTKLQGLIDQYRKDPAEAIAAFHRLEGRVGKDEIPEKKPKAEGTTKADDAGGAKKPKPSSEVSAKAGTAAPQGAPEMFIKGTHTLNPAWQEYRRTQTQK